MAVYSDDVLPPHFPSIDKQPPESVSIMRYACWHRLNIFHLWRRSLSLRGKNHTSKFTRHIIILAVVLYKKPNHKVRKPLFVVQANSFENYSFQGFTDCFIPKLNTLEDFYLRRTMQNTCTRITLHSKRSRCFKSLCRFKELLTQFKANNKKHFRVQSYCYCFLKLLEMY